jgi:hypothetical protein
MILYELKFDEGNRSKMIQMLNPALLPKVGGKPTTRHVRCCGLHGIK